MSTEKEVSSLTSHLEPASELHRLLVTEGDCALSSTSTKFASLGSRQAMTANRKRARAFSTDTVNAALAHLDSLIRQDRSATTLQQQSLVLHLLHELLPMVVNGVKC